MIPPVQGLNPISNTIRLKPNSQGVMGPMSKKTGEAQMAGLQALVDHFEMREKALDAVFGTIETAAKDAGQAGEILDGCKINGGGEVGKVCSNKIGSLSGVKEVKDQAAKLASPQFKAAFEAIFDH